jgi:hypothetical protein
MAGAAKAMTRATARKSFFMMDLLELLAGGWKHSNRGAMPFDRTTYSQGKEATHEPLARNCCLWPGVAPPAPVRQTTADGKQRRHVGRSSALLRHAPLALKVALDGRPS